MISKHRNPPNEAKRRERAAHVERVAQQTSEEYQVSVGGRVSLREWKLTKKSRRGNLLAEAFHRWKELAA